MFQKFFAVFLFLFATSSIAHSAEDIWGFREQRVGLGYLYLNQNSGGDVSTGNLIYDFNFFSREKFFVNGSAFVTSYKESTTDETFWISSWRLTASYKIADTAIKPQIYAGYELWDGRGAKFEYGVGVECGLQQFESVKAWIDSVFLQVGKINHSDDITAVNLGVYKNF